MFRKKLVKRVASCLMAFAMVVSGFPGGTFIGKAATEEDEVKYVVAGGSTPVAWSPDSEENVMKKSKYDGVYTISFKMPAYDEERWFENRFDILRQDKSMSKGWSEMLCLGTDVFDWTQTYFQVENEEETYITIYYQPESGAVVILDNEGNAIDYYFSWLGDSGPYVKASYFLEYPANIWPSEYLHVDSRPNIAAKNEKLLKYIQGNYEYTDKNNKYLYKILEDGNICITSCESTASSLIIPNIIDGKSVTRIDAYAFDECNYLENVYIPESIIDIGNDNFENVLEIYGKAGSYAEQYAEKNNISFNKILVDNATGIKVFLPTDYGTDVSLKVEQLTESPEGRNIILEDNVAEYRIYDIALLDSNGEKISLDEEAKVMIPEPDWKVEESCDYTVKFGRLDESEWDGYKYISTESENDYEIFNTNEWGIYAFRLYTSENPNYTYRCKILDDGCIEIVKGSYFSEKLIIPETIKGRKVTSIGESAFSDFENLESVEIPDSVVSIGELAFAYCHNLKNVRLSNNLTKIERQTFWYSGSNVKANGIEIPDGVVSIEEGAFGYSGFEYIKIPKSVTTMDTSFEFCSRLKRIDVDEENTQYSSKDGVLFDKKMETLIKYPNGSEYVNYRVPEGTIYIASAAFATSGIESIEIPDTVKKMGNGVFWECRELKDVKLPESIDTIEVQTFCCCRSLQNVNIPNTVTKINDQAFAWCESLTKLEIPSSVKTIEEDAIIECNNLTIYGEKGSAIEVYAKENNIPFVISSKLYDSSTGIEVEFQDGDKKDGVSLKTKLLTESDEQYKNIILTDNIVDTSIKPEDVKLNAYDITLVDENNNQVQPTKSVTVRIHCPDGYNGAKCKAYRVEGKGKYTDMNATYQNGYMVFYTDHFSTYIVTETELKQKADILYGDANGDGQVNTQDAVLIKKYLAEYDNVDIDLEASDVNGDGTVTSADAVLLLKYLAEYDVTLGE